MNLQLLKRYMPKTLYGRAALILILPVISLQLVVSVVFIKRHFEDVTAQLTSAVTQEITIIQNLGITSKEGQILLDALNFSATPKQAVQSDPVRRWYDLSGIIINQTLNNHLKGFIKVDLPDNASGDIYFVDNDQLWQFRVPRPRLSAMNPHQLFVNMIFFGSLMTIIAYIYLRNQLRPVRKLAQAAMAFGRGESIPYKPAGAAELREAGLAFLQMRARIERHIDQRTMLLSSVSHDLRTPLTRLRLGLSMQDSEDSQALLQDVADMQHLLDEYLTFASTDAGSADIEACDLQDILRQIEEAHIRQNTPINRCSWPEQITAQCRAVAIKRAIDNLVTNAQKFGTFVSLSASETQNHITITVEDNGPGIPPESRDEVLMPFVRLDASRNQNGPSGVGLGLSIAADIAHMHGGQLILDESPNYGGLRAKIILEK